MPFRKDTDHPRQHLARHVLPNAATMLGVCVTIIGLVKIAEAHIGPSRVDEFCALTAVLFLVSSVLSYVSLRSVPDSRQERVLERLADTIFLAGLFALTVITLMFAYEVI